MTSASPLHGIRVVDFTRDYAGAFIPLWLAGLGAEVVKIESNARPDITRHILVSAQGQQEAEEGGRAGFFHAINYSKESITIDLRQPGAADLVKPLVAVSDVVTESYSTGVMERYGLGYEDLRRVRPDLVMVSLSGFGRTGPYKDYRAYGHVASSFGGVDAVTAHPGQEPSSIGSSLDGLTGLTGTFAALMALHHRGETGHGQHIDLAMYEVQMSVLPEVLLDFSMNGRVRQPQGNHDEVVSVHNCYSCQDGEWLALAAPGDREWQALCAAMDSEALAADPRFADGYLRWRHRDAADAIVVAWAKGQRAGEAAERLQQVGVPAGRVMGVPDLLEDPHVRARQAFFAIETPGVGPVLLERLPGDQDGTLGAVYRPAPRLGQHNDRVFGDLLGVTSAQRQALQAQRIVF